MLYKLFNSLYQNKIMAVCIASLWTAIILWACFMPGSDVPKIKIPHIDKAVHIILFAGFTYLWHFTLKPFVKLHTFTLLLITLILGTVIEIIQDSGWIVKRGFEIADIVSDVVGGILGCIVFKIIHHLYLRKN